MSFGCLPAGLDRAGMVAAVRAVLDPAVPHGAGVVLALSGGPDSTALAYLVTEARPDLRASVAHVRHGLRDDAEDARVAAAHASALGLGYHERPVRVDGRGEGREAAARRARYRALAQVAEQARAGHVLVGHCADDQAETLLLNLVRGSGTRGLAGMATVRRSGELGIVRPLLRIRRGDLRAFLAGEGLQAVADPTNRDPDQRRARARHQLLPALGGLSGGPGDAVGSLTRAAELARADADALDQLAAEHARRLLHRWGAVRALRSAALAALPSALGARVVRLLLGEVRGGLAGLDADSVAAALRLRPGQAVHVAGGAWVTAGAGWLAAAPAGLAALPPRELALPGLTPLPELGMALRAELPDAAAGGQRRLPLADLDPPAPVAGAEPPAAPPPPGGRAPTRATLPGGVAVPLLVRARRPGDRIRLSRGRRKLQDLLVDRGVPRAARDLVPVIADARDEPVWVPGVALRHSGCRRVGEAGPRLWLTWLPGAQPEAVRYG